MEHFIREHWWVLPFLTIFGTWFALHDDWYKEVLVYFEPENSEPTDMNGHILVPHEGAPRFYAVPVRIYEKSNGFAYKIYENHRFTPLDENRSARLTALLKQKPQLVKDSNVIVVPPALPK